MKKNCIVSFANTRNNYVKGLERLNESLRHNFTDGDFLGFVGEATVGAPLHTENMYAFKIFCIQKAIDAKYQNVLWLDSSCFAIKNVQPIFDDIEENGMIYQDSGHWLNRWCNDKTLEYHGITREESRTIRMIGNAGFLGLNMNNDIAKEFFTRWKQSMLDGMFKGQWTNESNTESDDEEVFGHRHDMSNSSALVYKMGLTDLMKNGEEWLSYSGVFDPVANDTIIIKAQGM